MSYIPFSQIEAIAATLAGRFDPDQIILFGSYAYGQPRPDSDLDLLVVMPFEGFALDKACELRCAIPPEIAMDILIRKPEVFQKAYQEYDPFIRYAVDEGKLLYERHHPSVA